MGQTVYADVLFLINFSMDFLVFYICARLTGKYLYVLRCGIAAAAGGIYGIVVLFIPQNGIFSILSDLLFMVLICAVAFYRKTDRIYDFLGRCLLFGIISVLLGGLMTAMYSMLNRSGLAVLENESGDDISIWFFALLAAAGGAAAFVGSKRMRRITLSKTIEIRILFETRSIQIRGMTDTGNLLADPLSGRCVAVCELDAVKGIFPEELVNFWRISNISHTSSIDPAYATKLRFIPARGATESKTSILCAIVPDKVTLIADGKEEDADILIAPVPYKLSAGESRALVPPGLI